MKWIKQIVLLSVMTITAWSAVSLEIQNVDTAVGTLDIYMTNEEEVGGFQFELLGINITGASTPDGFFITTSSSLVIGFSLTGATIPVGSAVLTTISFTDYVGGEICFGEDTGSAGSNAISDANGGYIAAEWGPCFGGDESIPGCMDMNACNYNSDATENDGSCVQPEENFDCDGNCIVEIDCNDVCGGSEILDCNDVCGGTSVVDNCDTCDNDPGNDCLQDCFGIFQGTGEFDNCSTCIDCSQFVEDCTQHLAWNQSCTDCSGELNGNAFIDACEDCVGDTPDNPGCLYDCEGEGSIGIGSYDNCGDCDDNSDNDCEIDCNGDWGGAALIDNCGHCYDGETGEEACIQDCNGDGGGTAVLSGCDNVCGSELEFDECGICNGDGPEEYFDCDGNCTAGVDCAGVCGGSLVDDTCGVCNGDSPDEGYDCNRNCTVELDCAGVCGGTAEEDDCGECGGNRHTRW